MSSSYLMNLLASAVALLVAGTVARPLLAGALAVPLAAGAFALLPRRTLLPVL